MAQRTVAAVVLLSAAVALNGQARLTFDVASIRPSGDQPLGTGQVGVTITSQQVRFAYMSLRDSVAIAHDISFNRVFGPDWLTSVRFDIAATLPAGATRAQMPAMFRSLLEDRFQMRAHREQREFPIYALEISGGGIKLTKSADQKTVGADAPVAMSGGGSARGLAVDLGGGSSYVFGDNKFQGRKLSMAMMAEALSGFLDRPIVDMTKVEGQFDVALEITSEDYQGMLIRSAVANGIQLPPQVVRLLDTASIGSLIDALRHAGLSLQGRRAPLEVIVVDSISKAPTAN